MTNIITLRADTPIVEVRRNRSPNRIVVGKALSPVTLAAQVATRTALKALSTASTTLAFLTESGRTGLFVFRSGDYSTEISADTLEGIYVKADDTAASSGAWVREYVGATDPRWWGAVGDGTTDDTAALNAALSIGGYLIDGQGLNYEINSSVTVPADVMFRNFTVTAGTSAIDMILVNSRCKVFGKIVGTSTHAVTERGVYPAADNVNDVELNLEVTGVTYGVHARPTSSTDVADAPARWYGHLHFYDIEDDNNEAGYGLQMSPAVGFNFTVKGENIKRHLVYLSAGTRNCTFDVDCDGCDNFVVNIFATSGQSDCRENFVRVRARNLTGSTGTGGVVGIIQNAHYNTVVVDVLGSSTTYYAVNVEGASGGPYPKGNKVINGSIRGQFAAGDVVRMQNADGTIVRNNSIYAYGTASAIASRTSGTNGSAHGGFIEGNIIDCQGQNCRGVFLVGLTGQPAYVGPNEISNTGTRSRVEAASGSLRYGRSRKVVVEGTTASITAGTTADSTITLPRALQTSGRLVNVTLRGASVDFANMAFWTGHVANAAETSIGIRFLNPDGSDQTIDYTLVVEGD